MRKKWIWTMLVVMPLVVGGLCECQARADVLRKCDVSLSVHVDDRLGWVVIGRDAVNARLIRRLEKFRERLAIQPTLAGEAV